MNDERQQKPRVLPARAGIAWLLQSLALMRAQPGRLLLMVVLLQLIMGLTQVPLVGLLLILSVPALSAGLLEGFDVTARGGRPAPSLLFVPLTSRKHTGRMMGMGALMFLVGIISVALMLPANDALLDPELLTRIEQGDVEALSAIDIDSLRGMIFAFLIGISISGTLSYMTIPQIWFLDRKLGPALIAGLRVLMANWKPFLVLGLCMAGVLLPISLVAGVLFTYADSAGAFSIIVMAMVMILVLAFQLMLFGTQYCAFRDIFGQGPRSEPIETPNDSQLIA